MAGGGSGHNHMSHLCSESQAKMALNLLKWVCLLLVHNPIITMETLEMLVRGGPQGHTPSCCLAMCVPTLQCTFIAAIPNIPEVGRLRVNARHSVRHLFTNPGLVLGCLELVLGASVLTPLHLVLLDIIVVHFFPSASHKYLELVKCFCEVVLGSRVMPDYLILENCAGFFKMVTHQIFKDCLLPAMLKALLRNPDELIRGVCMRICVQMWC